MNESSAPRRAGLWTMVRLDAEIVRKGLLIEAGTLAFVLVTGIAGLATGWLRAAALMFAILPALMLLSLIDQARLTSLFGTMPVTRTTVMRAHYLLVTSIVLAVTLPWLVLSWVPPLRDGAARISSDEALMWVVIVSGMLLVLSMFLAVRVRFGATGGGYIFIATVALMGLIGGVVGGTAKSDPEAAEDIVSGMENLSGAPIGAIALAAVVIGLVAMAISCAISTRVYVRQDH